MGLCRSALNGATQFAEISDLQLLPSQATHRGLVRT